MHYPAVPGAPIRGRFYGMGLSSGFPPCGIMEQLHIHTPRRQLNISHNRSTDEAVLHRHLQKQEAIYSLVLSQPW